MPASKGHWRPGFALSLGEFTVILTVVVANLGNNIVSPLMPALRDHFGSSAAQISLVASSFGIGRLLLDLPAGTLTDRIGPTRMFTAGILLSATAATGAALSVTLDQLILFRTIMGFGSAIMTTVALVVMVNLAGLERRGRVLSYYSSGLVFGQAVGPALGGQLALLFDWRAAFLFCALTPLVTLPLNLLVVSGETPPRPSGDDDVASHAKKAAAAKVRPSVSSGRTNWPALVAVYLGSFTSFFDRQGMRQSLLPLYAGSVLAMDPGAIGNILTLGSLVAIAITLATGPISDRVGRRQILVPVLLLLASGNFCLLLGDSTSLFALATALISAGVVANSLISALVADLLPARLVGQGLGMYRFMGDLGIVVGPFILGWAVDSSGFSSALLVGGLVVIAGTVAVAKWIPRRTGLR